MIVMAEELRSFSEAREETLPSGLRGRLTFNEPMSRHTSWRAGGVAQRCYRPADLEDLRVFLRATEGPLLAVGLGSNLLVRDGGIKGTVVLLHGALGRLCLQEDGLVYAGAGVPGAKLARFAALHDLGGAEFFAGIPGTLGGMLAMNAGCYGKETWNCVVKTEIVTRRGELLVRKPEEYEIGYRHVERIEARGERSERASPTGKVEDIPSNLEPQYLELFAGAWLKFAPGNGEEARQRIKELLGKRIASQPLNLPNAGSVFRNPENDHAARLIELCGLKGKRMGGARVSEKHANFIVNEGGAKAKDIEELIVAVQCEVKEKTGVLLHTEVRIVGERET
jgi:UDP-N-acetylmuramate dehydrogenase